MQRCQQEFEEISQEIKKEMERFEVKRVHEFKAIIIKYLEDQMAHQQQVYNSSFYCRSLDNTCCSLACGETGPVRFAGKCPNYVEYVDGEQNRRNVP